MKLKNLEPLIAQVLCWIVLKIWFALVWKIFLLTLCTHMQNHAWLSPRNYTNLMPHSPLLIPNSVHTFIPVLNEGAATCFILNKRRLYLFLIGGSLGGWVGGGVGCVGIEEGFMHGHISPLKESPHCQLPTIIKQPRRVYHWLCLTSLIRQMCATYIGQQSSTAPITVPYFQTRLYRLVWLFPLLNSMKSFSTSFFKKWLLVGQPGIEKLGRSFQRQTSPFLTCYAD